MLVNRNKTGGRKAGTPNKTTLELRQLLSGLLQNEIERIPEYFERLSPDQRVQAIIRLLPFVIPKKQEIPGDTIPPNFQNTMDLGNTGIGLTAQEKIEQLKQGNRVRNPVGTINS